MSEQEDGSENPLADIAQHMGGSTVAPAHGIAAIALTMALKYHDINTVQDGVLYQQYKMEGRNLESLHLNMVFETAIRIERHLLAANERIQQIVLDALIEVVEEEPDSDKVKGQNDVG